jgi:predicted dehydrogenase
MGRWHAQAIRKAGGAVTWVVDPDPARARKLSSLIGGTRVASDFSAVVSARDVDVVHLCTPLSTHTALGTLALEAGFDTLVEKPLAPTAQSTRQLLKLAEQKNRLLCPVHQFLFQPGVLKTIAILHQLGPLLHVDFVACSAGAVGALAENPDLLIAEILPHPLALLARISDCRVAELSWHVEHTRSGEVRATTSANGVSVVLLVSAGGRPTTNTLRLIGSRATAHVDLFHGFVVIEQSPVSRKTKIVQPFDLSIRTLVAATANLAHRVLHGEPAYPGLGELVERFYRAARRQAPTPVSPDETLDVAIARDALIHML